MGGPLYPCKLYDSVPIHQVLIMDQSEIFMMQNWDHILSILDDIHKQPQERACATMPLNAIYTI